MRRSYLGYFSSTFAQWEETEMHRPSFYTVYANFPAKSLQTKHHMAFWPFALAYQATYSTLCPALLVAITGAVCSLTAEK